jgi:hypothetical protein
VGSHLELKLKVVDQPPHRSRRLQGLQPEEEVEVNPPPPPLRCRLDQSDTFVPTGPVKIINMEPAETNTSSPEVVTISYLGAEDFTQPFNPPLIGPHAPVVVQFHLLGQTSLTVSLFGGP